MIVFVPSRGFLFFYLYRQNVDPALYGFRPLTGISLFLSTAKRYIVLHCFVFVPSRGFLFFYKKKTNEEKSENWFSSPHGDFSFSILHRYLIPIKNMWVFVPSRGFLFFYFREQSIITMLKVFSSPHGDFSFSIIKVKNSDFSDNEFSSPHGDFSFSIISNAVTRKTGEFSSPHGDFSFSILK